MQIATPHPKTGKRRRLWTNPLFLALAVPLGLVVFVFCSWQVVGHRRFATPSGSMEPGLRGPQNGGSGGGEDYVQVDWWLAPLVGPKRGEIWVFQAPPAAVGEGGLSPFGGPMFIKRVIGLPGETVTVAPPRITVDGKQVVALTNTGSFNNGNAIPGLAITEEGPRVKESGTSVEIPYWGGAPVRVVAVPELKVLKSARRVSVDGRALLESADGRVEEIEDLRERLGAEAGVECRAFCAGDPGSDDPNLILVRGKKLEYRAGQVLINGQPIRDYTPRTPDYGMAPVKLGPDEYFMMGDNRNNSNDSHAWGPLKRGYLVGRADFRIAPLNRMGPL